jgi:hypothetical protein
MRPTNGVNELLVGGRAMAVNIRLRRRLFPACCEAQAEGDHHHLEHSGIGLGDRNCLSFW